MIVKEKVDEQTNGTVEMDISEATKANITKEGDQRPLLRKFPG